MDLAEQLIQEESKEEEPPKLICQRIGKFIQEHVAYEELMNKKSNTDDEEIDLGEDDFDEFEQMLLQQSQLVESFYGQNMAP